jgi:hypothetical protein
MRTTTPALLRHEDRVDLTEGLAARLARSAGTLSARVLTEDLRDLLLLRRQIEIGNVPLSRGTDSASSATSYRSCKLCARSKEALASLQAQMIPACAGNRATIGMAQARLSGGDSDA